MRPHVSATARLTFGGWLRVGAGVSPQPSVCSAKQHLFLLLILFHCALYILPAKALKTSAILNYFYPIPGRCLPPPPSLCQPCVVAGDFTLPALPNPLLPGSQWKSCQQKFLASLLPRAPPAGHCCVGGQRGRAGALGFLAKGGEAPVNTVIPA